MKRYLLPMCGLLIAAAVIWRTRVYDNSVQALTVEQASAAWVTTGTDNVWVTTDGADPFWMAANAVKCPCGGDCSQCTCKDCECCKAKAKPKTICNCRSKQDCSCTAGKCTCPNCQSKGAACACKTGARCVCGQTCTCKAVEQAVDPYDGAYAQAVKTNRPLVIYVGNGDWQDLKLAVGKVAEVVQLELPTFPDVRRAAVVCSIPNGRGGLDRFLPDLPNMVTASDVLMKLGLTPKTFDATTPSRLPVLSSPHFLPIAPSVRGGRGRSC